MRLRLVLYAYEWKQGDFLLVLVQTKALKAWFGKDFLKTMWWVRKRMLEDFPWLPIAKVVSSIFMLLPVRKTHFS